MSIVRKGRIDPIEILREYTTQKKPIILKQKKDRNNPYKLVFDNIELKCNMVIIWII